MYFDAIPASGPLAMHVVEATSWTYAPWPELAPPGDHYELVHVVAGYGQYLGGNYQHPYQPGDLYLLRAGEGHCLRSVQPTRFCVVRLHADLLNELHAVFAELTPASGHAWSPGPPALSDGERAFVSQQLAFCLREYQQHQAYGCSLLRANLTGVLLVLRRAQTGPTRQRPAVGRFRLPPLASRLVAYVQQHLREPLRLSAGAMGAHFGHPPRYVGQYFRRYVGQGLKQFVAEKRVYALQQELRYGEKTISELAFEYNFVDESHLGKAFRAITHQTPAHYRAAWADAMPLPDPTPVLAC